MTRDINSNASEIEDELEAKKENLPQNLFLEALMNQPTAEHIEIGPQKRKTPPVSTFDTVIGTRNSSGRLCVQSEHGACQFFRDDEIVEKLEVVRVKEVEQGFYVGYTAHNKAIVQQQASRGCTAAATSMLIIDQWKKAQFKRHEVKKSRKTRC